jgi:hypothetical protein
MGLWRVRVSCSSAYIAVLGQAADLHVGKSVTRDAERRVLDVGWKCVEPDRQLAIIPSDSKAYSSEYSNILASGSYFSISFNIIPVFRATSGF